MAEHAARGVSLTDRWPTETSGEGSTAITESAFSKPPERQRPPWWIYIIAACQVATLALIFYLLIWGPAELKGLVATFEDGAMVIESVAEDSEAARGGLVPGDRVLSIDDRPMNGPGDWTAATANWEPERPHDWQVSRATGPVTLEIVPLDASVRSRLEEGYIQYMFRALAGLLLGLFVAWKRPADPVAQIGAWLLMTASVAFGLPQGWAAAWRALPAVLQLPLWLPQINRFVFEGIFLSFFLLFPRRLFASRLPWFLIWSPVLVTLPWRIAGFDMVIRPGQGVSVPVWVLQAGFLRTIVYLLLGIAVLAVGYRRLLDLNEKRRVRVLMAGTALSATSAVVMIWFDSFYGRSLSFQGVLFVGVDATLNQAFLLSFAYAVVRHRVLSIGVIIRQGLQYALLRGALLGVVPILSGVFIADLAINSNEPLAEIVRSRGWIYAILGGFALLGYSQRKAWLESLDRLFFREQYNAQRVLRDVVGKIREARSLERVAPQVVARIETALHPEFASVLVCQPDEPHFRPLASFPAAPAGLALTEKSRLVALLRVLEKPLEGLFTDSAGLVRQIPADELRSIRSARLDLLVPIVMDSRSQQAVLALGAKRSEEPYTHEDQELLEAIASSLALLLEQTAPVGKSPDEMLEECPECGLCYEVNSNRCRTDGALLRTIRLPRTLGGRYRLERRRGRGGMGTVYEATDRALERRVAVKVIREDWVGGVEAAQRFRREARAAASLAHPNVVTVHDYGVEAGTRAFLVMEFLEGRSMREELATQKPLDPGRTLEILGAVCSGVDAAHRTRLIHRDLKPENIFLATSGESGESVKVLDFGLAKFVASPDADAPTVSVATATGALVGTPAYMSPEQLLGESPGVNWDLWALAVVAYESLTGASPFSGASMAERRNMVLSCDFIPLDRHFANPPDRWQAFFVQSFNPDPTQRPRSVNEFFHQLEHALSKRK